CALAGADLQRARAALAAEGLASAWLAVPPADLAPLVPLAPGEVPVGLLAAGLPPERETGGGADHR
ncbi:MAG: hypothetical protein J2P15_13205, partial [Micromonosporaceae bacterium]|nr:hypothetical protein [Micromonosporaceae bacterium]